MEAVNATSARKRFPDDASSSEPPVLQVQTTGAIRVLA
jgi:hypothetical protein